MDTEFYEILIKKLEQVKVYEDNYTLCSAAAGAIKKLLEMINSK